MDLYFITGTSSGLGSAITEAALEEGHAVVGIGRQHPHTGQNYHPLKADLSQYQSAAEIALQSPVDQQSLNRIVLINNAGVIEPVKHMGKAAAAAIQHHYQVNLVAPAMLINTFLQQWANTSHEKVILNVSSGAAFRPIDGWGCYCSAKAGLAMLTQVVNEENKIDNQNCRIYALAPGVVDTPMQNTIRSAEQADFSQLERFQRLKEEQALVPPATIARKFLDVVNDQYQNLELLDRLN